MSLLTKIKNFVVNVKKYTTIHQHQRVQVIGNNCSNCIQCNGSIVSGGYQPTGTLDLSDPPRGGSGVPKKPVERVEIVIKRS